MIITVVRKSWLKEKYPRVFRKLGKGWFDNVGYWTVPYEKCDKIEITYTHPQFKAKSVHAEAALEEMVRKGDAIED